MFYLADEAPMKKKTSKKSVSKKKSSKKCSHKHCSGDCRCGHCHESSQNQGDFKRFENANISFLYPSNWQLEHTTGKYIEESVTLSNDNGAFWMLCKYPFGTNPEEIAREAVAAMESEYDQIETEPFEKNMFGKKITGFEMTFFYLDLMNLAKIICFEDNKLMSAVFWQTGNQLIIRSEDSLPVEDVLEAITYSLLADM
ncbi:MAG: hypothetical protein FWE67_10600 [Planctomycetaceae bacterium]|nr:hypothetical protein [Planctomycetaceae bacterium]